MTDESTSVSKPARDLRDQPEKKSKKDKPMKMVYSDNDVSPEEKMALMPRYAFVPEGKAETAPAEATAAQAAVVTVDA